MKNFIQAPEALPYKKQGKNKMQSSPNKHGCENNNYGPHNFAAFAFYFYVPSTKVYKKHNRDIVRCIDCWKSRSTRIRSKIAEGTIANVCRFKDGYWEIELNHDNTQVAKISKMDW